MGGEGWALRPEEKQTSVLDNETNLERKSWDLTMRLVSS